MATGEQVADEKSEPGPIDKVAEYFGLVIAYLLPGLVGLWAASYWSPNVKAWMSEAATHSTSLGGFLFLMVAAVGSGMALHTGRWAVFEELLPRVCSQRFCEKWILKRPAYDESRAKEAAIQTALIELRDQHYRYYQCHGGLALGVPLAYLAWLLYAPPAPGLKLFVATAATVAFSVVSFFAALDAQKRLRIKRLEILGGRK